MRMSSAAFLLVSFLLFSCTAPVSFEEACSTHKGQQVSVVGKLVIKECYANKEATTILCTGSVRDELGAMKIIYNYYEPGSDPVVLAPGYSPEYPIEELENRVCKGDEACSITKKLDFRITGHCETDTINLAGSEMVLRSFTVRQWKDFKYLP